ncbi:MAG TPA: glycoside hydrolase family 43 protein [Verrucomicrobiales bacterium]|nr:glycoside hydrolase family 43 protein [Verrucomicrobiales bacterium]
MKRPLPAARYDGMTVSPLFSLTPVAACLLWGVSPAGAGDEIRNPLTPRNFPDPYILTVKDSVFAFATNSRASHVQVMRSADWLNWEPMPDALPQLPPWAGPGKTWAPEVAAVDGGYVLYFTAHDRKSGRQAVGAAFAKSPSGPFADQAATPLICQADAGGSIDASPFTDPGGTRWLLWKNDGNAIRQKTWIWIQRLSRDGLHLEGSPKPVIQNDAAWEGHVVEAPTLLMRGKTCYLFYSGGNFADGTYAVGCATAPSLTGPWKKCAANPILRSAGPVSGPGHQHVFADSAGQWWMCYHAWETGKEGPGHGKRTFRMDRLTFAEDGTPRITPTLTAQPAPARPRP